MSNLQRIFLSGLFLLQASLVAAPAMINALAREHLNLNGQWAYIVDPFDNGYVDYRYQLYDRKDPPAGGYGLDQKPVNESDLIEYAFDPQITLSVPGDWNSQDDRLFYYEGSVWYRRGFTVPEAMAGMRLFLYFGGANYQADVYFNGRKLGQHIGGFTPFEYEVTDRVRAGENSLVVRVNNQRLREGIPMQNADWWNYGGLTRDVRLIAVPETYLADYSVQLTPDRTAAEVRVRLRGPNPGAQVHVKVPELGVEATVSTDGQGVGHATLPLPGVQLWKPSAPKLYEVVLDTGADVVRERIGFRTIATRGKEILLNGEPIFLRGISIHEENPLRGGRAVTEAEARMLLQWAQELGCNYARLAHYPHNEYMARVADEMGILLWEEIPVYWTIAWENPDTLANAQAQLTELIARDKNRASVIIWSVANETPPSEPRTRFLKALVDTARSLDSTRLISAALEVHPHPDYPGENVVADPFGQYTDVVSFNQYTGWYGPVLPDTLAGRKWRMLYDKPVLISEFGGGALSGFHGPRTQRFTEEYQAWLYTETLPMLETIDGLSGMTPWILADFRSPRRPLYGIQDGWNRKGLIGSNGQRKQAFAILKAYYEKKAAQEAGR